MESVAILGATGSIGKSSLDVISRYPDRFTVYAVTANSSVKKLAQAAKDSGAKVAVIADKELLGALQDELKAAGSRAQALAGAKAIDEIASSPEVDIVIGAIVGAAGISSTFKAAEAGKKLLLANKESVVCGGRILMDTIKASGAVLMPVDSEHNAIFQCLVGATQKARCEANILLTCSGGPFRQRQDLSNVTVEEATHHPNWSMGHKITIDSATLVNKGLEVMEAKWLFGVDLDHIQVVVQPKSIIHSMVEFKDGAVMAQLGTPDMKLPIQYALYYPERRFLAGDRLDFAALAQITFEKPDMDTFLGLPMAMQASRTGGSMPTVFNAANERAVALFLAKKIRFLEIYDVIAGAMEAHKTIADPTLEQILAAEQETYEWIANRYKMGE